jgi:hypothetical protein
MPRSCPRIMRGAREKRFPPLALQHFLARGQRDLTSRRDRALARRAELRARKWLPLALAGSVAHAARRVGSYQTIAEKP